MGFYEELAKAKHAAAKKARYHAAKPTRTAKSAKAMRRVSPVTVIKAIPKKVDLPTRYVPNVVQSGWTPTTLLSLDYKTELIESKGI